MQGPVAESRVPPEAVTVAWQDELLLEKHAAHVYVI